jgi:carbon-monoxide dehydrogenase large subunit
MPSRKVRRGLAEKSGGNFRVSVSDKGGRGRLRQAHAVAEVKIVSVRASSPISAETRAAIYEYDAKARSLSLTVGSQGSHRLRDILSERAAVPSKDAGDLPRRRRFRHKRCSHREYALMAVAARKLKKAVKWTADRSDHFMGDAQGRDNVTVARMAREDAQFWAWMST